MFGKIGFCCFYLLINSHVCGQAYWFHSGKNRSTGDFCGTNALVLGFKNQTKFHEVRIVLWYKNDTKTPAFLELWVSEFGPGLGQKGKDPTKRWKIEGFFPCFNYILNDETFWSLGRCAYDFIDLVYNPLSFIFLDLVFKLTYIKELHPWKIEYWCFLFL